LTLKGRKEITAFPAFGPLRVLADPRPWSRLALRATRAEWATHVSAPPPA